MMHDDKAYQVHSKVITNNFIKRHVLVLVKDVQVICHKTLQSSHLEGICTQKYKEMHNLSYNIFIN